MGTSFEKQMKEIPARVRRGVAWLNKRKPNWRNDVQAERLDMGCDCDCVIGQALGNYFDVFTNESMEAVALGFNAPEQLTSSQNNSYFEALEKAWTKQLPSS